MTTPTAPVKVVRRNILLLGHSFLARLANKLSDLGMAHYISYGCANVVVKKADAEYHFDIIGQGGAKIVDFDVPGKLQEIMSRNEYDCVGLQLGSNDLCPLIASAEEVSSRLYSMAQRLRDDFKVRHVIMFETLYRYLPANSARTNKWNEVSHEDYNDRVQEHNDLLRAFSEGEVAMHFQTHFYNCKRLGNDGIHIKDDQQTHYWNSGM